MTRALTVIQPDSYDFNININFFTAATEPDFYERRKLPTHQTHFGFNNLSCWIPKESVFRNIHYDSFTHWQVLLMLIDQNLGVKHELRLLSKVDLSLQLYCQKNLLKSVVTKQFQKNHFKAHTISTTLRLMIPFQFRTFGCLEKTVNVKLLGE